MIEKRSLVLHYDEDRDEIVFFSRVASAVQPLRDEEGFVMPLSELRTCQPEEGERMLGQAVLAMFDSLGARNTRIRDYEGEMTNDVVRMVADLEPVATGGDVEAQYDLSVLYRDLARRQLSWAHFDKAEALTRAAAAAGLPAAVSALRHWERVRYAFTRLMERSTTA